MAINKSSAREIPSRFFINDFKAKSTLIRDSCPRHCAYDAKQEIRIVEHVYIVAQRGLWKLKDGRLGDGGCHGWAGSDEAMK